MSRISIHPRATHGRPVTLLAVALLVVTALVATAAASPQGVDLVKTIGAISPEVLATANQNPTAIPTDLSEGYSVTTSEGPVQISLVGSELSRGERLAAGLVSFGETEPATHTVLAEDRTGEIRVMKVLAGPQAPETYRFRVEDPTVSLSAAPTGHVMLSRGPLGIGSIAPPWAFDAERQAVPTWYSVSDETFTLHVAHRGASVSYPVVADPIPAVIVWFGVRLVLGAVVNWGARSALERRGYVCPWWARSFFLVGCYQRVR